jgi:hypothetical protein
MIRFFLVALLAMSLTTAAAIIAAVLGGKKIKKLEAERDALRTAFRQVMKKAERLQWALDKEAKVEEEADAERNSLAQTPDSGLAGRANALFGGMRNSGNGRPDGTGNAGGNKTAGTAGAGDGAGAV